MDLNISLNKRELRQKIRLGVFTMGTLLNACVTTPPDQKPTLPAPGPVESVESPAAQCDELLGVICPRDKVEPHTCVSMGETTERPDGKFQTLDISECHSRRKLAGEICKAGLVPAAANIRCQPAKSEKRTIQCAEVLQTMCASHFAPATCIGVLNRPKLPPVHFVVDGSNQCAADSDLQKKICSLANAENNLGSKNQIVKHWTIACSSSSGGKGL